MSFSNRAPPQKFGVNFGQFRQPPLHFQVGRNAGAGLLSLRGGFEQEFSDPAGAQTLHQVIKRAVLESPAAAAVRFAARQVLFDIGRTQ